jgi:hypothetical protein
MMRSAKNCMLKEESLARTGTLKGSLDAQRRVLLVRFMLGASRLILQKIVVSFFHVFQIHIHNWMLLVASEHISDAGVSFIKCCLDGIIGIVVKVEVSFKRLKDLVRRFPSY